MNNNIKTGIGAEIDAILYAWRTKALNVILTALAVVPAVVTRYSLLVTNYQSHRKTL